MKRPTTIIKELESSGARLAVLQRQQEELARELSRIKEKHDLGVEHLIIDIVRRSGIANLPISEIVAALDRLARSTGESLSGVQSEEMTRPRDDIVAAAELAHATGEPGAETFVKISSNASAENRAALENAGLRWNGKQGGFVGRCDAATIARLRETFGARVLKPIQVAQSEHTTPNKDAAGMVSEVKEAPGGLGDSNVTFDEYDDRSFGSRTDSVADSDPDVKLPASAAMSALRALSPPRGFPARKPAPSG